MKSLRFHELLLVSQSERTARRIQFHPTATVIKGANDTGKSSVIKSLYMTLGATAPNVHAKWKAANVVSALRFSLDGIHYRMLRRGGRYALFDYTDSLIRVFDSVTNDLAPFFADLFSFHLILKSRADDKQATPAFLFLPFYIDQDRGWGKNLDSFESLQQFKDWRSDVVHFHAGIQPSEYYLAKAATAIADQKRQEIRKERDMLQGILKDLDSRIAALDSDVDIGAFKSDVEELLRRTNDLRTEKSKIKKRMASAFNLRRMIIEQRAIVQAALEELQADRRFAAAQEDTVICPTCHAVYENDFTSRFEIALDEDSCIDLLGELGEQLHAAEREWEAARSASAESSTALDEIERLLSSTKRKIMLRDVLRREGQKEIYGEIRKSIGEYNQRIGELDQDYDSARARMKELTDRKKKKEITEFYRKNMDRLLQRLSVLNIAQSTYNRIDCLVKETGSDLSRAIIAYYVALLHTIHKYSSSTFCPIVIDSPRQQDQDQLNFKSILGCLKEEPPKDAQLILATVEDDGMDFGGTVIQLKEKRAVLNAQAYNDVADEVVPLLQASLKTQ